MWNGGQTTHPVNHVKETNVVPIEDHGSHVRKDALYHVQSCALINGHNNVQIPERKASPNLVVNNDGLKDQKLSNKTYGTLKVSDIISGVDLQNGTMNSCQIDYRTQP